jgi:PilZ domain
MSLWAELRQMLKTELHDPDEPRGVPRLRVVALTSYYWDGAEPAPHGVRDISESGMYIYTRERWYPGTLVLMRLERESAEDGAGNESISVLLRVRRWGEDGVGLEFVFEDPDDPEKSAPLAGGAKRSEFQRFLGHLKSKQGESVQVKSSKADRSQETPALKEAGAKDGGVGAKDGSVGAKDGSVGA